MLLLLNLFNTIDPAIEPAIVPTVIGAAKSIYNKPDAKYNGSCNNAIKK